MSSMLYIVGPTATGKSDLAADVAVRLGAEIINADAFQIYEGFDVLSAKPGPNTVSKVPHHLIGAIPAAEEMSAARYRDLALPIIADIEEREKVPLIVGGTGLYVKALTDGLADLPAADARLRKEFDALPMEELCARLTVIDPAAAETVDLKNRRRVTRALEVALVSGRPASEQRLAWAKESSRDLPGSGDVPVADLTDGRRPGNRRSLIGTNKPCDYSGVFVYRDREELYQRIDCRVETMLRQGAIEEVREAGKLSRTAEQMIGIRQIREYLAGRISLAECTARIQQLTRRYAKRQLTWFRHQTNLESLNLSLLNYNEAIEWVSRRAVAGRAVND
jgi:tRNA dimethylallyltransferase